MGSARFFENEVAVKADHSTNYKRGKRSKGYPAAENLTSRRYAAPDLTFYGAVHDNHGDKMDQSTVCVTYPLNGAHLRNNIALRRLRSKSVGGKPAARKTRGHSKK